MFQRVGPKAFKKDLKNIKILLSLLGNPEHDFKSIHIAGTNGKGTTAHMISALLQGNDFKVGLYTSPHYRDFRERIKINGEYISASYVSRFVDRIKQLIEAEKIQASFFEITVAMAFQYFSDQKLDFAVIETGLGGRLDSTNVISPEVSLITNISLDHTNFLGNTLKAIAKEKAGIIKKQTPVIIGEYQKEVAPVFSKIAKSRSAKLSFASRMKLPVKKLKGIEPPFFKQNRDAAIATYLTLAKDHPKLNTERTFLNKTIGNYRKLSNYIGRWQVLNQQPLVIADSAHNEGGLRKLFEYLEQLKFEQLHIVFGMVGDKDSSLVLSLLPQTAQYYFVAAKIPRAKSTKTLQEEAKIAGLEGNTYQSVRRGLAIAKRHAGREDLILVIGSIFVVAEVV